MKSEVTLSLCGIHASELGWPKPQIGFAKGRCFACGREALLHIVGNKTADASHASGRLEIDDTGKVWFIPLSEDI